MSSPTTNNGGSVKAAERRVPTLNRPTNGLLESVVADTPVQAGSRAPEDAPTCGTAQAPTQDAIHPPERTGAVATAPAPNRLERTRQINREAQARYRNRLKQESEDLEMKVAVTKCKLDNKRVLLISMGKRNGDLHKRICSAMDALLRISRREPLLEAPRPDCPGARSQPHSTACPPAQFTVRKSGTAMPSQHEAASAGPQSPAQDRSSSPSELPTLSGFSPPPCIAASSPGPPQPPPAAAPAVPAQQMYAPLTIESVFAAIPGVAGPSGEPPHADADVWRAAAAEGTVAACCSDEALAAAQRLVSSCARAIQAQREDYAAAAGVGAADVAWSLLTPYKVAAGAVMSLSSTVSTVACCSSLYIFYFASRLEGAFLATALDSARRGAAAPPEDKVKSAADLLVRKVDGLLDKFASVRSVLSASCNVGHTFPVAAGCTRLITDMCVRFRNLLPRHAWLQAASLFIGLLVPTAAAVGPPREAAAAAHAAPQCTISSALFNSHSVQLGYAMPPQAHRAEQCPKCSVVPHIGAALRQQLLEVIAAAPREPQPALEEDDLQDLEQRMRCISGAAALVLTQCTRDSSRVFRNLHSSSPNIAPEKRQFAADAVTAALYRKIDMSPPQRALAAAMWHLWRRQRVELDRTMQAALRALGRVLCVTDLSAPSVRDLERLLSEPDESDFRPPLDSACSLLQIGPPQPGAPSALPRHHAWATSGAANAPGLPPLQPVDQVDRGAGLEPFLDRLDCAACCAAVRAAGVPCTQCAGALARKMLGVDGHTTDAARSALRKLQGLQQEDVESFIAVMLAVTMPGVVFSTPQIAMHVPLVLSAGVPLMDWLHLCKTAAEQIKHEELMAAFTCPMLDGRVVIAQRGRGGATEGSGSPPA